MSDHRHRLPLSTSRLQHHEELLTIRYQIRRQRKVYAKFIVGSAVTLSWPLFLFLTPWFPLPHSPPTLFGGLVLVGETILLPTMPWAFWFMVGGEHYIENYPGIEAKHVVSLAVLFILVFGICLGYALGVL